MLAAALKLAFDTDPAGGAGDGAVSITVGYHWHLRAVIADRGMFQTSDLVPRLAERGGAPVP